MISNKEISNKEVIQEVFSLINQFQDLNAFITLNEENSIKKAEELDNCLLYTSDAADDL